MSENNVEESTKEYTIAEMVKSVRKARGLAPRHRFEQDTIPTEKLSALFHAEDYGQVIIPDVSGRVRGRHRGNLIEASLYIGHSGNPRHREIEPKSLHELVTL